MHRFLQSTSKRGLLLWPSITDPHPSSVLTCKAQYKFACEQIRLRAKIAGRWIHFQTLRYQSNNLDKPRFRNSQSTSPQPYRRTRWEQLCTLDFGCRRSSESWDELGTSKPMARTLKIWSPNHTYRTSREIDSDTSYNPTFSCQKDKNYDILQISSVAPEWVCWMSDPESLLCTRPPLWLDPTVVLI